MLTILNLRIVDMKNNRHGPGKQHAQPEQQKGRGKRTVQQPTKDPYEDIKMPRPLVDDSWKRSYARGKGIEPTVDWFYLRCLIEPRDVSS